MIPALIGAGLAVGYLVNPRLASVHWQAGGRPLPSPWAGVAGERMLWVDPAEVPLPMTYLGCVRRWPLGGMATATS